MGALKMNLNDFLKFIIFIAMLVLLFISVVLGWSILKVLAFLILVSVLVVAIINLIDYLL